MYSGEVPYDDKYITYYENGQIMEEGNYEDGKVEGEWSGYYENGQIRYKIYYKNDKEEGKWSGYYENGQLKDEGNFKNTGEPFLSDYIHTNDDFSDHNRNNEYYSLNRKFGKWIEYYDNGQVRSKGNYTGFSHSRNGTWTWYHKNGQKLGQGIYKDRLPWNGLFINWDDISEQIIISEYNYKNGKKHGKWITYHDKDGQIFREKNYKNGELIKEFHSLQKNPP